MQTLLILAVGATLGAALRYYVGLWALERLGRGFPYGTLIVNLAGSLVLGWFTALAARRPELATEWRLLVATGFCGSLTTFSTLSVETLALIQAGRYLAAALNGLGSLALGLACVIAGAALGRLAWP